MVTSANLGGIRSESENDHVRPIEGGAASVGRGACRMCAGRMLSAGIHGVDWRGTDTSPWVGEQRCCRILDGRAEAREQ